MAKLETLLALFLAYLDTLLTLFLNPLVAALMPFEAYDFPFFKAYRSGIHLEKEEAEMMLEIMSKINDEYTNPSGRDSVAPAFYRQAPADLIHPELPQDEPGNTA